LLSTLEPPELIRTCRHEIQEILKGFHIIGEDIEIDPDELIALYDKNHTGTLEDNELVRLSIFLLCLKIKVKSKSNSHNIPVASISP